MQNAPSFAQSCIIQIQGLGKLVLILDRGTAQRQVFSLSFGNSNQKVRKSRDQGFLVSSIFARFPNSIANILSGIVGFLLLCSLQQCPYQRNSSVLVLVNVLHQGSLKCISSVCLFNYNLTINSFVLRVRNTYQKSNILRI